MKMIHIAGGPADSRVWTPPFRGALGELGELAVVEQGKHMAGEERLRLLQAADVVLLSWGAAHVPEELARDPGRVRYVCNVTGSLRPMLPAAIMS